MPREGKVLLQHFSLFSAPTKRGNSLLFCFFRIWVSRVLVNYNKYFIPCQVCFGKIIGLFCSLIRHIKECFFTAPERKAGKNIHNYIYARLCLWPQHHQFSWHTYPGHPHVVGNSAANHQPAVDHPYSLLQWEKEDRLRWMRCTKWLCERTGLHGFHIIYTHAHTWGRSITSSVGTPIRGTHTLLATPQLTTSLPSITPWV